jgi:hypothetical protein
VIDTDTGYRRGFVRTFACHHCGQLVFFENSVCLHCHSDLGFAWTTREIVTRGPDTPPLVRCANAALAGCNGVVSHAGELCRACALTRTRPSDRDAAGLAAFAKAEAAKRRLVFELLELGLPVHGRDEDPEGGMAFDLLSSAQASVTTGHADGLITLDLAETDDVHRVRMRHDLNEPYRTLLGHFRHEIAHYYFPVLTRDEAALARARATFGDERADYGQALDRHYAEGAPDGWEQEHVSAYATMHPAEDWAETFAHYLHIRDTLQTAASHRLRVLGPQADVEHDLSFVPPPAGTPLRPLLDEWLPLTYALNALNRSMGLDDLYPFVLAPAVIGKLEVVHELVLAAAAAEREPESARARVG